MSTDDHLGEWLTVGEVAHDLNVSKGTVRRWIGTGELAATKLGPHPHSPVRVPRVSVQNLLVSNTVEAA